jgi:hypothetical protein
VELDAPPLDVLQERIESVVRDRMDLDALAVNQAEEDSERDKLKQLFRSAGNK